MKTDKLAKAAKKAQEAGYEYIHVLVMMQQNTRLYHIMPISDVLFVGHWVPARIQVTKDDNGRNQTTVRVTNQLPEKSIEKSEVLRRFK